MDDAIHRGGVGWFSFQDSKFREHVTHRSVMSLNSTIHSRNRNVDLEVMSNK